MRRTVGLLLLGFLGLLALGQERAPEVYLAELTGQGLKGRAVVLALPQGGLEVFVYLEGLRPGSGAYANHIHYNQAGNANCRAQNGDQILGLTSLVPDANGRAVAYTRLPNAKLPMGSLYVNVHANTPTPVGASIACGDLEEVGETYPSMGGSMGESLPPCPEVIQIQNFAFQPERCLLRAGQSLRFRNLDAAPHTATAAGGGFDTGTLNQGQTSAPIALKPGTYTYTCRFHPSMRGEIVVR